MVGGLLGTVAGILIADYWIIRRTVLDLADLYRARRPLLVHRRLELAGGRRLRGRRRCSRWAARTRPPGKGPFPADGLIPFLKPLADYGWAVGLASSLVLYTLLSGSVRREQVSGRAGR